MALFLFSWATWWAWEWAVTRAMFWAIDRAIGKTVSGTQSGLSNYDFTYWAIRPFIVMNN